MSTFIQIVLLLGGFVCLVKGADFFVDGSSAVAKKMKVPSIVVGLTIVAIGTSLPELAVSMLASIQNSNAIAYSNVVGSNLFNLLMVLGVTSLFIVVPVKTSILKREIPFLIGITMLLVFLAGDYLWFSGKISLKHIFMFSLANEKIGAINRMDGILFVLLFVGFIAWTVSYALKERQNMEEHEGELLSNGKCVLYIIGGAIGVMLGGEVVVECAKRLAATAGMSETLIGLTIVALGTSLPELVTSVVAARKGEADIAIGNVVGSNISNILLVLGLSSAISPVSVVAMSLADAIICLGATIITLVIVLTRKSIQRFEGILMILIYAAYMAYILARQYM
ncbi:MAG: calcium/sodium antiporter [Eubacterium sp.]|nr:calcium/sodium antiporter [Eubacterium sp.]